MSRTLIGNDCDYFDVKLWKGARPVHRLDHDNGTDERMRAYAEDIDVRVKVLQTRIRGYLRRAELGIRPLPPTCKDSRGKGCSESNGSSMRDWSTAKKEEDVFPGEKYDVLEYRPSSASNAASVESEDDAVPAAGRCSQDEASSASSETSTGTSASQPAFGTKDFHRTIHPLHSKRLVLLERGGMTCLKDGRRTGIWTKNRTSSTVRTPFRLAFIRINQMPRLHTGAGLI